MARRWLGGICVRNSRAGLAHVEKGLNLAVTSVMNLVIILAVLGAVRLVVRWQYVVRTSSSRGGTFRRGRHQISLGAYPRFWRPTS